MKEFNKQEVQDYFHKFKFNAPSLGRILNKGGCSYEYFKYESLVHIKGVFTHKYGEDKVANIKVLDVGPGAGGYQALLDRFLNIKNIDCVEVYTPHIEYYQYEKYYSNVFNCNILDFEFDHYDLIIMGDILEHIEVKQAQKLIKKLLKKCDCLLVAVPYNYVQGPEGGNQWEEHLQPDLTPKNFVERYPDLKLVIKNKLTGLYSHVVL
tara:strand:- start:5494 stop:6117 length:624 start_codon:yes stop_codon:yes gene_type:complete